MRSEVLWTYYSVMATERERFPDATSIIFRVLPASCHSRTSLTSESESIGREIRKPCTLSQLIDATKS